VNIPVLSKPPRVKSFCQHAFSSPITHTSVRNIVEPEPTHITALCNVRLEKKTCPNYGLTRRTLVKFQAVVARALTDVPLCFQACPRGSRPNLNDICVPCSNVILLYEWMYLAFMAVLPLVLHGAVIDMVYRKWRK
jgi:JNK1/MAPK8-associated membrane protein